MLKTKHNMVTLKSILQFFFSIKNTTISRIYFFFTCKDIIVNHMEKAQLKEIENTHNYNLPIMQ